MALMTMRPWKHLETGIDHRRRAVPPDLRVLIGKREEKLSLICKNPRGFNLGAVIFAMERGTP